jgi:hypothetical protein
MEGAIDRSRRLVGVALVSLSVALATGVGPRRRF